MPSVLCRLTESIKKRKKRRRIVASRNLVKHTVTGADPGFFAGGGGGGGQRRPCKAGALGARTEGGGSRVDKHQIKVHSVHRIFQAIFFFFCYS